MQGMTEASDEKNEDGEPVSLDDVVDSFGCNKFSLTLILIIGVLWASESTETNLISLIGPQLRCVWQLSSLQVSMTSSTVFLGAGIGSAYWGFFGDIYGRKKVMIGGAFLSVYFGLLSAVSPNFKWFLITRFFVGIGLGPAPSGACYVAELITRKHRGKAVLSVDLFYAIGSIYVAIIALFLMRDVSWRVFLVAAVGPGMLFLIFSAWLPESVRYLQNTGRYDEIVKILHRISLCSGTQVPRSISIESSVNKDRGHISMLFQGEYRKRLAIVSVLFISSFWGYFGLILLNTELLQSRDICRFQPVEKTVGCRELSKSDYLQNIIVVTSEIPGLLLPVLLVDYVGRKCFTCAVCVISAIGFLCLNSCLPTTYITVIMYVMRFLLIGFAQIPYLLTSELFPTVIRTTTLGIIVGLCKFTLIGVPYFVQYLAHVSLVATTSVFAALQLLSAALVLLLPDTRNKSLDEI